MKTIHFYICLTVFAGVVIGDCPLDHYLIGINEDGIAGTEDDNQLYVDCSQIYRHSDPDYNNKETWLYRHYPLYYSAIYNRYQIGEPGFDLAQNDPNRQLQGTAGTDYQIYIECVSVKSGLSARNTTYGIFLDNTGDTFCHSILTDPHVHLQYRVNAPAADGPYWITYRIFDAKGQYEISNEFTLVFMEDLPGGDVDADEKVNLPDLQRWMEYWLMEKADRTNDYYNRCDINLDGRVDLADFALLAENWTTAF